MPREATDPNLVQDLRTAVEAVRHEVRAGRTDTLESLRALSANVRETRELVIEHLGEHKGRAEASGEHMGLGQAKVAKWGVYGRWFAAAILATGALWSVYRLVGASSARQQEPPMTRVEMRTEIKAAVRGEIKAAVADAFADMRDDEP